MLIHPGKNTVCLVIDVLCLCTDFRIVDLRQLLLHLFQKRVAAVHRFLLCFRCCLLGRRTFFALASLILFFRPIGILQTPHSIVSIETAVVIVYKSKGKIAALHHVLQFLTYHSYRASTGPGNVCQRTHFLHIDNVSVQFVILNALHPLESDLRHLAEHCGQQTELCQTGHIFNGRRNRVQKPGFIPSLKQHHAQHQY